LKPPKASTPKKTPKTISKGIKNLPGFLFGYVRQPSQPNQKYDIVHVFDCTGDTRNLRKQRAITSYELNEEAMYNLYRQLQQF